MLRSLFRSAWWPVPVLSEKPFTDEGKRLFPDEQSENPPATCHLKKVMKEVKKIGVAEAQLVHSNA